MRGQSRFAVYLYCYWLDVLTWLHWLRESIFTGQAISLRCYMRRLCSTAMNMNCMAVSEGYVR